MVVAIKKTTRAAKVVPQSKRYAIIPDTRVFKNLGQTGEAGYKCLAELIDNSLDARGANRATVNITYTTRRGRVSTITIEDDCSGMTEQQLVDAFKIGKAIKRDSSQIGRFGMGLKTAISALGTKWTITTGTEKCESAHRLSENLDEFVKKNNWEIEIQSVEKNLPIEQNRGTRIEIGGCDALNANLFERDLVSNLGELFKHFLNTQQLVLTVNEVPVPPSTIRVLTEGLTELNTQVGDKTVRGWIGLRDVGTQNYGFSLIRHSRVIETNVKLGFMPHPAHNRIVGELHLDEFATNHHKTAFNRNNDDWAGFEEYITEQVKPLLALARDMANRDKKKINEKINAKLAESIQDLLNRLKLNEMFQGLTTGAADGNNQAKGDQMPEKTGERTKENDRVRNEQKNPPKGNGLAGLNVRHEFVSDGANASRKRWEIIEGDLMVGTNMDHPLFEQQTSQHAYAMQNCQEAIAAFYAQTEAAKANANVISYETYDRVLETIIRIANSDNVTEEMEATPVAETKSNKEIVAG